MSAELHADGVHCGERKGCNCVFRLQITHDTHVAVDLHMQGMLDGAYDTVKALLERNRAALDALIDGLMQAPNQQLEGPEVQVIIEQNGNSDDLRHRSENKTVFA